MCVVQHLSFTSLPATYRDSPVFRLDEDIVGSCESAVSNTLEVQDDVSESTCEQMDSCEHQEPVRHKSAACRELSTQLVDCTYLISDCAVLEQLHSDLHKTPVEGGLLLRTEHKDIPTQKRRKCMPQQCVLSTKTFQRAVDTTCWLISDCAVLEQLHSDLHKTYSTLLKSTPVEGGLLLRTEHKDIPTQKRRKCMPQQWKKRKAVHGDDRSNEPVDKQVVGANCEGTGRHLLLCTVYSLRHMSVALDKSSEFVLSSTFGACKQLRSLCRIAHISGASVFD